MIFGQDLDLKNDIVIDGKKISVVYRGPGRLVLWR